MPTYVSRIKLRNWLCFGEVELQLEPRSYAIVGRTAEDPEASNLSGKSALVEAIDFALYGRHRKKTEDAFIRDGTHGCDVELQLSDGSLIKRTRRKGGSTRLLVVPAGTRPEKGATQAEAQRIIDKQLVGLGEKDSSATWWFGQKQMSRFVTSSEDRAEIVSGWFELGPLQRAEDACRQRLGRVVSEQEKIEHRQRELVAERHALLALEEGEREETAREMLLESSKRAQRFALDAKERYDAAKVELAEHEADLKAFEVLDRYEEVVARGKKLRAERDALEVKSAEQIEAQRKKLAELESRNHRLGEDLRQKRHVAQGKFDGTCPVVPLQCPIRDQINSSRKLAQEGEDAASEALTLNNNLVRHAESERVRWSDEARKAQRLDEELSKLTGQAKELKHQARGVDRDGLKAAQELVASARVQLARDEAEAFAQAADVSNLEVKLQRLGQIDEKLQQLAEQERALSGALGTHREAMMVFGRNGAQRRVAEAALRTIEAGANEQLAAVGAPFTVSVLWAREGKDPAKHCDACGFAFPASRAVKQCARCKEPRGVHMIQRLEVELSRQSGAADDLAGMMLQLSASSWLRERRGSDWSTVVMDEPGASLDKRHRRGIARTLGPALAGFNFVQSFLISHSPDAASTMQGMIEIVNDGGVATARVVA